MQSEIFQAFICYNFDDNGLQLMKTLEYCAIKIIIKIITNKGLNYLTLHVMSILVSPFKLNY